MTPPRRPDTFIIGAPRCGTTSMHSLLGQHPDVYMSPRKEPRYFAPDLRRDEDVKDLRFGTDERRYLALFSAAHTQQRLGEASPQYLYSPAAPGLIRDFQPHPYLIVMLRDPVVMMRSLHNWRSIRGIERRTDFVDALAAEERSRAGLEEVGPYSLYRARASYGAQLTRWFGAFPRERFHITVLEDFIADPAHEFRRLLEFLEVDPEWQPASFAGRNATYAPRSDLIRRIALSRPVELLLWRWLAGLVGEARLRATLGPLRGINRGQAAKATVDPQLRDRLRQEMADDVALTSQLLGRDLAALWWG